MFKKLLCVLAMFFAASAWSMVDVNKADLAKLESVKGIGSVMSTRILEERKKSPFRDWPDLMSRVKGVKEGTAAKLSKGGLTVNGASYATASPAPKPPALPAPKQK